MGPTEAGLKAFTILVCRISEEIVGLWDARRCLDVDRGELVESRLTKIGWQDIVESMDFSRDHSLLAYGTTWQFCGPCVIVSFSPDTRLLLNICSIGMTSNTWRSGMFECGRQSAVLMIAPVFGQLGSVLDLDRMW